MARRSTSNDKIRIDPIFQVPEGAEDEFAYTREVPLSEDEFDNLDGLIDVSLQDITDYVEDDSDDTTFLVLDVPDDFVVFSQTIRRSPGGQQVVDVILQVEDIIGAENYEVRVTKI